MDIIIGNTKLVQNNDLPNKAPRRRLKKGPFKDRRKSSVDRRRSVRDGVFVHISNKYERRKQADRRKLQL